MFFHFVAVTALLLGARHALEPDHLAAVSVLVADERRLWPAARLGLFWGLGHMLTMGAVGIPVLLLHLRVPPLVEPGVDLAVGTLLIALGVSSLLRLYRERGHVHVHAHGDRVHMHFHTHRDDSGHEHAHATPDARRPLVTFAIGCMHGLGGSGAVVVMALAAAPSITVGAVYLLAFGVGTVLGMFGITLAVAAPALVTVRRVHAAYRATRVLAGVASMGIGAWMWIPILSGFLVRG